MNKSFENVAASKHVGTVLQSIVKLPAQRNLEQITFTHCLLPLGPKSSVFLFAV